MEREEQEKLVSKAFTADRLFDGLEKDLVKRNGQIAIEQKEVERLDALKKTLDMHKSDRDILVIEIENLKKEIDGYVATLEKERISLPFGSRGGTRRVNL